MSLFLITGEEFGSCEVRNGTKSLQVFVWCRGGTKGNAVAGQWMWLLSTVAPFSLTFSEGTVYVRC